MRLVAYKYRIYPNKDQESFFAKSFGCVRFVYNKALQYKISLYEREKKGISVFDMMKEMKKWKYSPEFKWLGEVSSQSLQQSLVNLDKAFTNFFKEKKNFPKFKSKKHNNFSFSNPQFTNIDWDKNLVYIPKLKNGIKVILHRKFNGKIKTSTISKAPSGKYFISILVETDFENPTPTNPEESTTLGIDLGIKHFATYSNGEKISNPKYLNKSIKRLKTKQRKLNKKQKGSKNREKQRIKIAKLHEKIKNCRKDFLHKVTKNIIEKQDYTSVAIENLSVKNMILNKKLSRSISDVGWGIFKELITYKSIWYGKNLIIIGRFDPSSKLCSCGYVNNNLSLKDRKWTCEKCELIHDRDILAANNIKKFAFCKQNTQSKRSANNFFGIAGIAKSSESKDKQKPVEFFVKTETMNQEVLTFLR